MFKKPLTALVFALVLFCLAFMVNLLREPAQQLSLTDYSIAALGYLAAVFYAKLGTLPTRDKLRNGGGLVASAFVVIAIAGFLDKHVGLAKMTFLSLPTAAIGSFITLTSCIIGLWLIQGPRRTKTTVVETE